MTRAEMEAVVDAAVDRAMREAWRSRGAAPSAPAETRRAALGPRLRGDDGAGGGAAPARRSKPKPVSAEELAGATVTRCPTAAVEPTTATIPEADRRALEQYGEARAEQALRERTGRAGYPKQRGER